MTTKTELFFSVDIETDGPNVLTNSMLSLGVACFKPTGELMGTFSANLKPREGAVQDERTMRDFWAKNPEAWEATTKDQVDPHTALPAFVSWVDTFEADLKTCVAFPAGFDFTFLYPYMLTYAGRSPFAWSCLDVKTMVSVIRRTPYRFATKKRWPKRWFNKGLPHTHVAIEDAIEQGLSFLKMRADFLEGSEAVTAVDTKFWETFDQ
tara:strand:+ start:72048 stop:72671 length:624 start_codon:yes stop_codon:yes gene_type:complete